MKGDVTWAPDRIARRQTDPEPDLSRTAVAAYRLDWPRTSFLSFFLLEPRGVVRLALGAAFLRAARFNFFRSILSSILVVSATCNLFHCNVFDVSRRSDRRVLYVNRDFIPGKADKEFSRRFNPENALDLALSGVQ